jgi:dTDP-4-amino-4,6-dideoxygalactose transaminase
MSTVPFLDLKSINLRDRAALHAALDTVLDSGWVIMGNELSAFEREFADYCGVSHCVGVANGLDAMHLVLRAWDIGPGDEVIVPSNTYTPTPTTSIRSASSKPSRVARGPSSRCICTDSLPTPERLPRSPAAVD